MDGTQFLEVDRLEALVQLRLSGRVHNFRLLQRANGLILRGQARTYYAKQLATHAALNAVDPITVTNAIEVH